MKTLSLLKLTLVALLLFPTSALVRAQGTSNELIVATINWQKFESADGRFSVQFPAAPKIGTSPFQKGPVTFVRHTHQAQWGSYFFEVDYWDVSSDNEDPDLRVEGGVAGMIRSLEAKGGRLLSKKTIGQNDCVGREARMVLPMPGQTKEGFAVGRVFSTGHRAYVLVFVSVSDDAIARVHSETFLDSFSVNPRCSSAARPSTPAAAATKTTIPGKIDVATGWRRIESPEHGFSALMPGEAELETKLVQTQPYKLSHYTFSHARDLAMFSIEVVSEYPANFHNAPESMKTLLDVTTYAMKRNLEPAGFVVVPTKNYGWEYFPDKSLICP